MRRLPNAKKSKENARGPQQVRRDSKIAHPSILVELEGSRGLTLPRAARVAPKRKREDKARRSWRVTAAGEGQKYYQV